MTLSCIGNSQFFLVSLWHQLQIIFKGSILWRLILLHYVCASFMRLFIQLFWIFSIYLEALAIVPQLILLQRYREVENLTGHYVFLLGIYRALYIANWIYRSYHEAYYKHNWVVYFCGFVQTCLYLDFFYYYFLRFINVLHSLSSIKIYTYPFYSKYRNGKFVLPNQREIFVASQKVCVEGSSVNKLPNTCLLYAWVDMKG